MSDVVQKIMVGLVSATVSGGITLFTLTANWTGRLQAVEQTLTRIEMRLDGMAKGSKE